MKGHFPDLHFDIKKRLADGLPLGIGAGPRNDQPEGVGLYREAPPDAA